MQSLVILLSGGTGFVGRHTAQVLESKGHKVIVSSRTRRAVPTQADVIINLAGIIREGKQSYEEVHVENTKWLLRLAQKLKVQQFVQMSALGAKQNGTRYQRTKAHAERLVQESGIPYVIIRPSMIFGPDDASINTFRAIARTGFFPILADGKVQPVSVTTVAELISIAAERKIRNRIVEVGGPEVFTQAQLADRLHPGVVAFHMPAVRVLTFFGKWISALPTAEQVVMLGEDNTTKDKTVEKLGIKNPPLR